MSNTPRIPRRPSALDRLDTVPARQPDVDPDLPLPQHHSVPPASALPGSMPPESVPSDVGSEQGEGWGIAPMPAWLDPPRGSESFGIDHLDEVDDPDQLDPDDPEVPDGGRRRFLIAPPAAIVVILIGVIACVVAGFTLFRGSDIAPAVDFPSAAGETTPPGEVSSSGTAEAPALPPASPLVVSVVGLVHRPGLVRLPANSRVADAIALAGGPRQGADMVSLNQAQIVRDGDQVLVGYAGTDGQMSLRSAVVSAGGSSAGTGAAGGGPSATGPSAPGTSAPGTGTVAAPSGTGALVNLNTASEAELDTLPGVGPVTAAAIVDWRSRNGRFASVDQLGEVEGIGPSRLAKLRGLVTV